jgi:hypothetical protein
MNCSLLVESIGVGDVKSIKVIDGAAIQSVEFISSKELTNGVMALTAEDGDEGNQAPADHSPSSPLKHHVGPYDNGYVQALVRIKRHDGTEDEIDLIDDNVSFKALVAGQTATEDAELFMSVLQKLELKD